MQAEKMERSERDVLHTSRWVMMKVVQITDLTAFRVFVLNTFMITATDQSAVNPLWFPEPGFLLILVSKTSLCMQCFLI